MLVDAFLQIYSMEILRQHLLSKVFFFFMNTSNVQNKFQTLKVYSNIYEYLGIYSKIICSDVLNQSLNMSLKFGIFCFRLS